MSRNPFGWDLPPGCRENDPNAPWNKKEHKCCPMCCDTLDKDWKPICLECDRPQGVGVCLILDSIECNLPKEPECTCLEGCNCYEDTK